MRIELEIDDRFTDTNLYLFWGMVPVARRLLKNQYWEIKTGYCSMCGKCCGFDNTPFKHKKGSCEHLEESPGNGKICSLKNMRPVGCSTATPKLLECTVKWGRYK